MNTRVHGISSSVQVIERQMPQEASAAAREEPAVIPLILKLERFIFPRLGQVLGGRASAAAEDTFNQRLEDLNVEAKLCQKKQKLELHSIRQAIDALKKRVSTSKLIPAESLNDWKEWFEAPESLADTVRALVFLYHNILITDVMGDNAATKKEIQESRIACGRVLARLLPQETDCECFLSRINPISTLLQKISTSDLLIPNIVRIWKNWFRKAASEQNEEEMINTLGYLYHRIIIDHIQEKRSDEQNKEFVEMVISCERSIRLLLPEEVSVKDFLIEADKSSRNVRLTRGAVALIQIFEEEIAKKMIAFEDQILQKSEESERRIMQNMQAFEETSLELDEKATAAVSEGLSQMHQLQKLTQMQGQMIIDSVQDFIATRNQTNHLIMTSMEAIVNERS